MRPLDPGERIGIMGGGQLGRMLAGAAARLGFDTSIFCPQSDSPAARVSAASVTADYDDLDAALDWARSCAVVTYEFENVPVATIDHLCANGVTVRPGAKSLEVAQDRLVEKRFLRACGIGTADFAQIDKAGDIPAALDKFSGRGLLKTRREGYDGKGQFLLGPESDPAEAFRQLGESPCILEDLIPFTCEVSVVIARDEDGRVTSFDLPRNEHEGGILRRSTVPAAISEQTEQAARDAAGRLISALDHVGVLALECFILEDGNVLGNEFAPRVHNSGHWTPEACATGQFEQHVRAVAGWPLGDTARYHDAVMGNLLGDEALNADRYMPEGAVLTLYGKRQPRAGRKMGHWVLRKPV